MNKKFCLLGMLLISFISLVLLVTLLINVGFKHESINNNIVEVIYE